MSADNQHLIVIPWGSYRRDEELTLWVFRVGPLGWPTTSWRNLHVEKRCYKTKRGLYRFYAIQLQEAPCAVILNETAIQAVALLNLTQIPMFLRGSLEWLARSDATLYVSTSSIYHLGTTKMNMKEQSEHFWELCSLCSCPVIKRLIRFLHVQTGKEGCYRTSQQCAVKSGRSICAYIIWIVRRHKNLSL